MNSLYNKYMVVNFISANVYRYLIQLSYSVVPVVESDASLDGGGDVVALDVGFHRLLPHPHAGEHTPDLQAEDDALYF